MRYRTAIITGASSGIGEALARLIASRGCDVGITARRADRLNVIAADINARAGHPPTHPGDRPHGRAFAHAADVTDSKQNIAAIESLATQLGNIDLMIANAGFGAAVNPDEWDPADIEQIYAVNLTGSTISIFAAMPWLLKSPNAHIVGISSVAGYRGLPGSGPYSASKAGFSNMLESLRIDLRRRNVAVTTIVPGFIRTPMTDANGFAMPWLQEVDVAAKNILRAIEKRKRVAGTPWQMQLLMRGLVRWMPDFLFDRVMQKHVGTYKKAKPGTTSPGA